MKDDPDRMVAAAFYVVKNKDVLGSLAEQDELIREGDKGGARNLASLDLAGAGVLTLIALFLSRETKDTDYSAASVEDAKKKTSLSRATVTAATESASSAHIRAPPASM